MKWSYAWSYTCFRILLLINYILFQKQQFKPKHLARILFGPVFRKSFAWMTIGVISLHSTQTLFLDYYKEYLGSNPSKGAKPFIPLPQHIQDIISEVRWIELCHKKTLLNIMPSLRIFSWLRYIRQVIAFCYRKSLSLTTHQFISFWFCTQMCH